MSLNLKDAKKGMSGPLAPVGNHIARCYQLVDLGTQDSIKYGNSSHKLRFAWELCEETHDFGKGKKEPYTVSMTVNFFFGRNSNFTKLLEGWKGGTFSESELETFELKRLLGKACMINVVHNSTADRDYANVASVSPLPAKWRDRVPALQNKPIYFETEMGPNSAEFKALPEFMQKVIEKCHEWRGSGSSLPPEKDDSDPFAEDEETKAINAETEAIKKRIEPDDSDDIPF
jgi:hypothetical protein